MSPKCHEWVKTCYTAGPYPGYTVETLLAKALAAYLAAPSSGTLPKKAVLDCLNQLCAPRHDQRVGRLGRVGRVGQSLTIPPGPRTYPGGSRLGS
jgi:hypothetical protein